MPQADAENRLLAEQTPSRCRWRSRQQRVAGAIERKMPRLVGQHLVGVACPDHGYLAAHLREAARCSLIRSRGRRRASRAAASRSTCSWTPRTLLPFEGPIGTLPSRGRGLPCPGTCGSPRARHRRGRAWRAPVHGSAHAQARTNARVSSLDPVTPGFRYVSRSRCCGSCWGCASVADHEAFDLHGVRFLVLGRGAVVR